LAEIARLQEQLPRNMEQQHASVYMLERYLDNFTSYGETVLDALSDNESESNGSMKGSIRQKKRQEEEMRAREREQSQYQQSFVRSSRMIE
jgi:hypothetical protein